jgi:hypothetical protein
MKTSESIVNISKALNQAQEEIRNASMDKKNPHFKNNYASLESVLEAAKPSLVKNKISPIQAPRQDTTGFVLTTRLLHESGEFIEFDTPLLMGRQDMQAFGSAITYARRYALASALGIAQADDDANEATKQLEVKVSNAFKKPSKPEDYVFKHGSLKGSAIKDVFPEELDAFYFKLTSLEQKNDVALEMISAIEKYKGVNQ